MDNTSTCNECGQLRQISSTDNGSDIEAINLNFEVLQAKIDLLESKLASLVDVDGNLDLNNKCITNLGDCCSDPKSIATMGYINGTIRTLVAKLVVDMVNDPVSYLKKSGVKFYTADGNEVVDNI